MAKTFTRTITIYSFAELLKMEQEGTATPSAVSKAREWLQEGQVDYQWWEPTLDTWKEALDQIGFGKADIRFTGFYSQGDGASFTATVDLKKLIDFFEASDVHPGEVISFDGQSEDFRPWILHKMEAKRVVDDPKFLRRIPLLRRIASELSPTVTRNHSRYSNENSCDFEVNANVWGYDRIEKLVDDFEKIAEELRRDLCHAIWRSLRDEYEWLQKDEQLIDTAEANGYSFTIDGKREGCLLEDSDA